MPINQLLSIIYELTAAGTLLYYIPTIKFEVPCVENIGGGKIGEFGEL